MLYKLNSNTYFYDARQDTNYTNIETYLNVDFENAIRKTKYYVSIKDKYIIRKERLNVYLQKKKLFTEKTNLLVYRNEENYQYCENLKKITKSKTNDLELNFDIIYSPHASLNSITFFKRYVVDHKMKLFKIFNSENIIELIKRFR